MLAEVGSQGHTLWDGELHTGSLLGVWEMEGHPAFQSCPACSKGAESLYLAGCGLPPRRGLNFGQGGCLWLRPVLGEGLSCELSVANTPGRWGMSISFLKVESGQNTTITTTVAW